MLVMIHVQTHTVITCYNRVIMACSVFYSSYNSVPYCFVCSSIQDALKLIYKVTPVFSSEPRGHIFFFWLSVCQTFTWRGMEFVVSGLMTKHLNVILLLMCEREVAPDATHFTVLLTTVCVCLSQTVNKLSWCLLGELALLLNTQL